jgi:hypothetical protein
MLMPVLSFAGEFSVATKIDASVVTSEGDYRTKIISEGDVPAEMDRTAENSYEEIPSWQTIALVKDGKLVADSQEYFEMLSEDWKNRLRSGEFYELTIRDFDLNLQNMRLNYTQAGEHRAQTIDAHAVFGVRFKTATRDDEGNIKEALGREGTHNHYIAINFGELDGKLITEISVFRKSSAHSYDLALTKHVNGLRLEKIGYEVGELMNLINKDWHWTSKWGFEDTFSIAEPLVKAFLAQPEVRRALENKIYENDIRNNRENAQ